MTLKWYHYFFSPHGHHFKWHCNISISYTGTISSHLKYLLHIQYAVNISYTDTTLSHMKYLLHIQHIVSISYYTGIMSSHFKYLLIISGRGNSGMQFNLSGPRWSLSPSLQILANVLGFSVWERRNKIKQLTK